MKLMLTLQGEQVGNAADNGLKLKVTHKDVKVCIAEIIKQQTAQELSENRLLTHWGIHGFNFWSYHFWLH